MVTARNQTPDFEDDWKDLRRTPTSNGTKVTEAPADLESDWAVLKNFPEYVYVARGDGGLVSQFSLWRMSVVGQKKVRRGPREMDCWVVTADKLLFYWGNGVGKQSDGRYAIPKSDCDLTFETAAARFKHYRDVHLETLQREIRNQEERIRSMLTEMKRTKEKIQSLSKIDLTPENADRDEKRSLLLSVLGQRSEQIKMREELEDLRPFGFAGWDDLLADI